MISIRPQETVRDLIKKCIDTSHLRVCKRKFLLVYLFICIKDSSVDNYILYALNETTNNINPTINSSPQLNQTQLIPLIGKLRFAINVYLLDIVHFDTKKEENKKSHPTDVYVNACKFSLVLLIFFSSSTIFYSCHSTRVLKM